MKPPLADWPAMVMTAGLGTRIRPLSFVRAKPAMPVAGDPLAGRILRWLAGAGVRRAVLNLHHRPETIEAAIGDGRRFGLEVCYSREDPLLGSAGGPREALDRLGAERFLIVNGDTITDLDPADLVARHLAAGALVTMAVAANPSPSHYGGVEVGPDGDLRRFVRPGAAGPEALLFIGVQAVEASAFERLPRGVPAESVRELYPALIAERPGSVAALVARAEFLDIGTPADYLRTSIAVAARERRWPALVAPSARVDPAASLTDTVVWDDVVIEGGVRLSRAVVGDGVRVAAGVSLSDVVLTRREVVPWLPGAFAVGDAVATPIECGRREAAAPANGGEGDHGQR